MFKIHSGVPFSLFTGLLMDSFRQKPNDPKFHIIMFSEILRIMRAKQVKKIGYHKIGHLNKLICRITIVSSKNPILP